MKKIFDSLNIADLIQRASRALRNSLTVGPPEQPFAGDRQMLSWVVRQFAMLFLVLTFFDDLLGFVIEVLHVIFELIHLVIEVIEHFLEEILEHTLHTDHHQSETIIVNAVLVIALYGLYRLYRASSGAGKGSNWPPGCGKKSVSGFFGANCPETSNSNWRPPT